MIEGSVGPADQLKINWDLIEGLIGLISQGESGLRLVPSRMKKIIHDGAWKDFTDRFGIRQHNETFSEWVTSTPLKGLGEDVASLQRLLSADADALAIFDAELIGKSGAPKGNQNAAKRKTKGDNVTSCFGDPRGNSKSYLARRLKKHHPEIYARLGEFPSVRAAAKVLRDEECGPISGYGFSDLSPRVNEVSKTCGVKRASSASTRRRRRRSGKGGSKARPKAAKLRVVADQKPLVKFRPKANATTRSAPPALRQSILAGVRKPNAPSGGTPVRFSYGSKGGKAAPGKKGPGKGGKQAAGKGVPTLAQAYLPAPKVRDLLADEGHVSHTKGGSCARTESVRQEAGKSPPWWGFDRSGCLAICIKY